MSVIVFEYAKRTYMHSPVPGSVEMHGKKHAIEISGQFTFAKLKQAELQFILWFQAEDKHSDLLSWEAKDLTSGTIYSQYRCQFRGSEFQEADVSSRARDMNLNSRQ